MRQIYQIKAVLANEVCITGHIILLTKLTTYPKVSRLAADSGYRAAYGWRLIDRIVPSIFPSLTLWPFVFDFLWLACAPQVGYYGACNKSLQLALPH
jgi:hypothetical protein